MDEIAIRHSNDQLAVQANLYRVRTDEVHPNDGRVRVRLDDEVVLGPHAAAVKLEAHSGV
jgi:hypothetical protein